jgi:hypothetical protein
MKENDMICKLIHTGKSNDNPDDEKAERLGYREIVCNAIATYPILFGRNDISGRVFAGLMIDCTVITQSGETRHDYNSWSDIEADIENGFLRLDEATELYPSGAKVSAERSAAAVAFDKMTGMDATTFPALAAPVAARQMEGESA